MAAALARTDYSAFRPLVLELAAELGVPLSIAAQASVIGDAGVATGHADPRL